MKEARAWSMNRWDHEGALLIPIGIERYSNTQERILDKILIKILIGSYEISIQVQYKNFQASNGILTGSYQES